MKERQKQAKAIKESRKMTVRVPSLLLMNCKQIVCDVFFQCKSTVKEVKKKKKKKKNVCLHNTMQTARSAR